MYDEELLDILLQYDTAEELRQDLDDEESRDTVFYIVDEMDYDVLVDTLLEVINRKGLDYAVDVVDVLCSKSIFNKLMIAYQINGFLEKNREMYERVLEMVINNHPEYANNLRKVAHAKDPTLLYNLPIETKVASLKSSLYISDITLEFLFEEPEQIEDIIHLEDSALMEEVFNILPLHYKKILLMSNNVPDEIKINLIKSFYEKKYGDMEEKELHDFVLNGFIDSFEKGNKISLLLFADFIETGIPVEYDWEASQFSRDYSNGDPEKKLLLTRQCVKTGDYSVLFHEVGHLLFHEIGVNKTPEEFANLTWNVRSDLNFEKRDEFNDFYDKIAAVKRIIDRKIESVPMSSDMKEIFREFITGNLKSALTEYMRKNGYSESIIKMIEERFSSLKVDQLNDVEMQDDVLRTRMLLSSSIFREYTAFEDFINALCAGDMSYLDSRNNGIVYRGHSVFYYHSQSKNCDKQYDEAIANFTSIVLCGNRELIDEIHELVGDEMFGLFEEMVYKFATYGIPEEDTELRKRIRDSLFFDSGRKIKTIREETEELTTDDLMGVVNKVGASAISIPLVGYDEGFTPRVDASGEEDFRLEAYKGKDYEDRIDELFEEFSSLSLEQKRKIIESDEVDFELKNKLVRNDLSSTFDDEESSYSIFVSNLIKKMDSYGLCDNETLLLIEAFIEIGRTKGDKSNDGRAR